MQIQLPPLALYIHIPWCVRKCPYCDFNSHAAPENLPVEPYLAALRQDLVMELAKAPGRRISSIFIGGGTPSLFPPAAIGRLLNDLEARLEPDAEITLEANPGTMEQDRFAGFRAAGVNRLSIGVQSFDPDKLARLGRIHGREEAIRAAESAISAGFSTYNLDLMFALPGQNLAQMLADLEQAIALQPPHLSHYQLTLEPNTVFHAHPPPLPDDDTAWAMQQAAGELLAQHGYRNYEVSAWSLPGHRCAHNLNYWTFGDYLAIGAGAHGKLTDLAGTTITRHRKAKVPAIYMRQAMAGRADVERRMLDAEDLKLEFMMNALRLTDGFPASLFEQRTGLSLEELRPPLDEAVARGWLEHTDGHIRTTTEGRCYLNDVLALFLPGDPGKH